MSLSDFGNNSITSEAPATLNDTQKPVSMTKSTFENLGIALDNGKPRFKLHEPVTSHGGISFKSLHYQQEDSDSEATSFIVLGKNSMDFINTASLADYEQIKEHSLAIDTSIVSTMPHEEIEKKVVELLQENQKLKETLAQNNKTMKHHFSTLTNYQKELRTVHENHKKKFAETRDMINILKEENAHLKMKLAREASVSSKFSGEMIGESTIETQQKLPDPACRTPGRSQTASNGSISSQSSSQTSSKFSIVAQGQPSNIIDDPTLISDLIEKKEQLECNLHCQREIIKSLKDQIHLLTHNSSSTINLQTSQNSPETGSQNEIRRQFLDNFTHYNSKLTALAKCYTAQMSTFTEIQENLKNCVGILNFYENFEPSELTLETRLVHKQKLDDCRKELIVAQLDNINERQNLIKAQKQFEKIFSDYNSALHELEMLQEEKSKPPEPKNSVEPGKLDILREKKILADTKKALDEEWKTFSDEKRRFEAERNVLLEQKALQQAFEVEKKLFSEERQRLEDQKDILNEKIALKEAFDDEKLKFEMERKMFLEEKAKFETEKGMLSNEKASLNSQGLLYEAQLMNLEKSARIMEKNQQELEKTISKLKYDLDIRNIEIEELRAKLAIAKEYQDENEILKQQLSIYKDDFEEEQRARHNILCQREELTDQLGQLREYNQKLLQKINGPNADTFTNQERTSREGIPVDTFCATCGLYKMPGDWHGPGYCQSAD